MSDIIIKNIIAEDFCNYKKPSMFIIFPTCNFKCCIEANENICQNLDIIKQPDIKVNTSLIVSNYIKNPISKAIVCGGLEPMDSFEDLLKLIKEFRKVTSDDIVIYTGYKWEELEEQLKILKTYKNIIVKAGRFIPNQTSTFDKVLGVTLASPNQNAKQIS